MTNEIKRDPDDPTIIYLKSGIEWEMEIELDWADVREDRQESSEEPRKE